MYGSTVNVCELTELPDDFRRWYSEGLSSTVKAIFGGFAWRKLDFVGSVGISVMWAEKKEMPYFIKIEKKKKGKTFLPIYDWHYVLCE